MKNYHKNIVLLYRIHKNIEHIKLGATVDEYHYSDSYRNSLLSGIVERILVVRNNVAEPIVRSIREKFDNSSLDGWHLLSEENNRVLAETFGEMYEGAIRTMRDGYIHNNL